MLGEQKYIVKLLKQRCHDKLKNESCKLELHPDAHKLIEAKLNNEAMKIIDYSAEAADEAQDRTIVNSHAKTGIEKNERSKDRSRPLPWIEIIKICGTAGLAECITFLVNMSGNPSLKMSALTLALGVFGSIMLSFGLFYRRNK